MEKNYVTITGLDHYYGITPFRMDQLILCKKQPDNPVDQEAIEAIIPVIERVGYIANSVHTVVKGTKSSGRIYDKVKDFFFVRVCFITKREVIGEILELSDEEIMKGWFDGIKPKAPIS